jgi:SAM-dependent methyltransferase
MAGFDPDWLALRAPYDSAARSAELTRRFAERLPDRPWLLDLAAGTGANHRFLAPRLRRKGQCWTLVDHDPALLAAAPAGVATRVVDLVHDLDRIDFGAFDGIVASALFDLVSAAWLDRLVALLARARRPVLFTLSVDGRREWTVPDADDGAIARWFARHQTIDKGFGPALGPQAPARLAAALAGHGFTVMQADSDWIVGPADRAMLHAEIAACRRAVLEVAPEAVDRIEAWAARRHAAVEAGAAGLRVGHRDVAAWI